MWNGSSREARRASDGPYLFVGSVVLPRQGEVSPQATEGEDGDALPALAPTSSRRASSPSVMLRMPPPPCGGGLWWSTCFHLGHPGLVPGSTAPHSLRSNLILHARSPGGPRNKAGVTNGLWRPGSRQTKGAADLSASGAFLLPVRSAYSFSVSSGTTLNRSPTRPMSATWKIGASSSLLIAMIVLLSFMPARCWIAPEMPTAT